MDVREELHRAYFRFLHRGLPRRLRDAAVEYSLRSNEPTEELLQVAWDVAGTFLRGQARKALALQLLLQWSLRRLEVAT